MPVFSVWLFETDDKDMAQWLSCSFLLAVAVVRPRTIHRRDVWPALLENMVSSSFRQLAAGRFRSVVQSPWHVSKPLPGVGLEIMQIKCRSTRNSAPHGTRTERNGSSRWCRVADVMWSNNGADLGMKEE